MTEMRYSLQIFMIAIEYHKNTMGEHIKGCQEIIIICEEAEMD